MLKLLKSMSRRQKRNVFVALDCLLVPASLLFAFALQTPIGGPLGLFNAYLPELPFVMAAAAGLSLWLGISTITLNDYEASSVGMTAVFAGLLTLLSVVLTTVVKPTVPISTQIVFGITYFVFSVLSRAILLQVVLAIYRRGADRST